MGFDQDNAQNPWVGSPLHPPVGPLYPAGMPFCPPGMMSYGPPGAMPRDGPSNGGQNPDSGSGPSQALLPYRGKPPSSTSFANSLGQYSPYSPFSSVPPSMPPIQSTNFEIHVMNDRSLEHYKPREIHVGPQRQNMPFYPMMVPKDVNKADVNAWFSFWEQNVLRPIVYQGKCVYLILWDRKGRMNWVVEEILMQHWQRRIKTGHHKTVPHDEGTECLFCFSENNDLMLTHLK